MRIVWLSFLLLLISIVYGNGICPSGYVHGANGGDCFKIKMFYDDSAALQFHPTSFDEAATQTSEEQDVDSGPSDDGVLRCYGIDGSSPYGEWQERECGKKYADCWACRVKARTIQCNTKESEYKGGCASVHVGEYMLGYNQTTAEAQCVLEGGHLASIHSVAENEFYIKLAKQQSRTTVYIGGQYSNGVLEWMDGTHRGMSMWASGFPNPMFGSCVQMLLDSSFGNQGQWTNADCSVQQFYLCFRDGPGITES